MEKFYSKLYPDVLLHAVYRLSDFDNVPADGRVNIIDDHQFIQCAALNMNDGITFRPHKHVSQYREEPAYIPQESWHVISGIVECLFFDLDNSLLATTMLSAGDTSFTLRGGHTYRIMSDNVRVLEYKTGPYLGQQNDKVFI